MKSKILISTSTFCSFDISPLEKLEKGGFEVISNPFKRKLTKDESLKLLAGVSGLIAGLETLDHDVLSQTQLKVISRCGAGLSNVDLKAAEKLGIKICNTPDGPTNAVAELTMGCILNLLRMVPQMNDQLHAGSWDKYTGSELMGKNVLIIGFGRIGSRLAKLLKPFGVEITIVDPIMHESKSSFRLQTLKEALPLADIITLHCSGDQCILGEEEFRLMKKGVFLLNASRGGLLSEDVLIKALNDGIVKGAWLDTFKEEPYKGDLMKFPQVILTPHVGSYTIETRLNMEMQAVDNLIAAFEETKIHV